MSEVLFVNGPVQNGDFDFISWPGKATGIRLAAALNEVLGHQPLPHLFNTVTLAGDLRHRAAASQGRAAVEAQAIRSKYRGLAAPAEVVTDADGKVAALALEVVREQLAAGALAFRTVSTLVCASCQHLTGAVAHTCRACGGRALVPRRQRLLVHERRPGRPGLDLADVHAHRRRAALHLRNMAGNVPEQLILARTRAHGIDLEAIGLGGLVLDPRAGLHVTALAAARHALPPGRPAQVVMTTTASAAANIAAWGQPFLRHEEVRLRYGLHGRLPYDAIPALEGDFARLRFDATARADFAHWFLPLYSWHEKNAVPAGQLPGLLKHFHRARLAAASGTDIGLLEQVRQHVRLGSTDWISRRPLLAAAYAQHATSAGG